MNYPDIPSPEQLEKLNGFKKFLVVLFTIISALVFVLYNLPSWAEPILYRVDESAAVEQAKENKELKKQLAALKAENGRISGQLKFYRDKSKKISLTAGAKEVFVPDLILGFYSWQDWQKEHPGKSFADFREAQIKHLQGQLKKAKEVLNQIKYSK